LDRTRGDPAATAPSAAAGAGGGQVLAFPGRFTLVVSDAADLPNESQKTILDRVLAEKVRDDGLRVVATLDRPPGSAADAEVRVAPELSAQGFPEIQVPSLSERGEDLELLLEYFLRPGPKKEGEPPLFTEEALAAIRKLTFREQLRDLRELCEKIGRFAIGGKSIDLQAIRTAITPTLRAARKATPPPEIKEN
jgi:DNA-binding NtrC family response regulator